MSVLRWTHLNAELSNLNQIEDLVYDLEASHRDQPHRVDVRYTQILIIITEMFENICKYGVCSPRTKIFICVRIQKKVCILFVYKTRTMDHLCKKWDNPASYFDVQLHRYRGLGLKMCKTLAQKTSFYMFLKRAVLWFEL